MQFTGLSRTLGYIVQRANLQAVHSSQVCCSHQPVVCAGQASHHIMHLVNINAGGFSPNTSFVLRKGKLIMLAHDDGSICQLEECLLGKGLLVLFANH